jgi:hypothetical protein
LSVPAVAAAVMLGLFASNQAGLTTGGSRSDAAGISARVLESEGLDRFLDPAHLSAVPAGPGDVAEPVRAVLSGAPVIEALGRSGIPLVALRAYQKAALVVASDDESCGLRWTLLAAIGRVESNHGRYGGALLREDGSGTRPIRGIPLDGRPNVALIRDTDAGALDGDTTYDRAVGPMQFIPSTWQSVGADGNGDGRRDPNNIYDAAYGAAVYLCVGDSDLRDPAQAARAVRRYNNADEYVRVVLSLAEFYETGRADVLPSSPVPPAEDWSPPENVPAQPAVPRSTTSPAPAAPPSPPAAPAPPAPVGTEPAPSPTDAAASAPTVEPVPPDETVPAEPVPPEETVPAEPAPPVGQRPTAAVGWAPAMREVVLTVLEEMSVPPGSAPGPTPESGSRQPGTS